LEDQNVHAFLQPMVGQVEENEIIMAATRVRNLENDIFCENKASGDFTSKYY